MKNLRKFPVFFEYMYKNALIDIWLFKNKSLTEFSEELTIIFYKMYFFSIISHNVQKTTLQELITKYTYIFLNHNRHFDTETRQLRHPTQRKSQ